MANGGENAVRMRTHHMEVKEFIHLLGSNGTLTLPPVTRDNFCPTPTAALFLFIDRLLPIFTTIAVVASAASSTNAVTSDSERMLCPVDIRGTACIDTSAADERASNNTSRSSSSAELSRRGRAAVVRLRVKVTRVDVHAARSYLQTYTI